MEVSFNDFIRNAGVSRGALKEALDEAVQRKFITRVREGLRGTNGNGGHAAVYELCWDESGEYITTLDGFRGFYAGEGNRTNVPDAFFDKTIREEPLGVVRVVGAITRYTIGFQAKKGVRRQEVKMSFTRLQRRTGLSRNHLNKAIKSALESNLIVRVNNGTFSKEGGHLSEAAVYGLRWEDTPVSQVNGVAPEKPRKTKVVQKGYREVPDKTTGSPKRLPNKQYKKVTEGGSKKLPKRQFKKVTDIEMTSTNNNSKQQHDDDFLIGYNRLLKEGFDEPVARSFAQKYPKERIARQCDWIDLRNPRERVPLLYTAIERDLPSPTTNDRSLSDENSPSRECVEAFYAELAGNTGDSVAPPSRNDLEVGKRLLERVSQDTANKCNPAQIGREFARYAKRAAKGGRIELVSFVNELRQHGDKFVALLEKASAQKTDEEKKKQRDQHRRVFNKAYRKYIEEREEFIRREHPTLYDKFINWETERREEYEKAMRLSGIEVTALMAKFDGDVCHLQRFREYFSKIGSNGTTVLQFWEWDQELNDRGLSSKKRKADERELTSDIR